MINQFVPPSATLEGNTATVGTGTWTVVSGGCTITSVNSPTSGITSLDLGATTLRWTIVNGECSTQDDVIITNTSNATGTYPAGRAVCYNTSTVITLTGSVGTAYQWEESDDDGVGDAWANAVGGSGSTTSAYTTPNLTSAIYYRCNITGGGCAAATTTSIYVACGANGEEIWIGDVSTNWFTHGNWCSADPQSSGTDVIIPANTDYAPIISGSGNISCGNLDILAGATMEHAGSGDWLIYGNFDCKGTLDHSGSTNCTNAYGYWILMEGSGKTFTNSGDISNMAWCCDGTSNITLGSNISVSRQWVNTLGTYNLSTYTVAVSDKWSQYGDIYLNSGTIEIGGTTTDIFVDNSDFHEGTGTVFYNRSGTAFNDIPSLDYYNLKVACWSGLTNSLGSSSTIANNLELTAGSSGGTFRHESTTLAIPGNLSVAANVTFDLNSAAGKSLDIGGSLTNNGTITCNTATNINLAGGWTDNGTFTESTSTVILDGSTTQSVGGTAATDFYNLTASNSISSATGVSLTSNITINNTLNMNMGSGGDLDLNGKILTLTTGTTANITGESNSDRIFGTTGHIIHAEDVNASAAFDFGGMGITLTPTATPYPGVTTIKRYCSARTNGSNNSIQRYYDISSVTNSGLTLDGKFDFFDDELNGNAADADMTVYKSADAGATWTDMVATWTNNGDNDYVTETGITGFSLWVVSNKTSDPMALPIELASFDAIPNNKTVELSWRTLSELYNERFEIERSDDAQNFEQLGMVPGAGLSNEPLDYEYIDYNPIVGDAYYRLTSVDYDGKKTHSAIRKVAYFKTTGKEINVFPNPAKQDEVYVVFEGLSKEREVLVVLVDVLGNEMFSKILITDIQGKAYTGLVMSDDLKAGIYTVIGSSMNDMFSKKLIIVD